MGDLEALCPPVLGRQTVIVLRHTGTAAMLPSRVLLPALMPICHCNGIPIIYIQQTNLLEPRQVSGHYLPKFRVIFEEKKCCMKIDFG